MEKYFNTAGPCNEKKHYIVPILERNTEIMRLVYISIEIYTSSFYEKNGYTIKNIKYLYHFWL